MKTLLILLLTACLHPLCMAQVSGVVVDETTGDPLPGATIRSLSGETGSLTDEAGRFSLPLPPPVRLVASFPGYIQDTLLAEKAEVRISLDMLNREPVVITGTLNPVSISKAPVKTEIISERFIKYIPAYTVPDILDYANGVNQMIGCGVCGTNDIHINGMEGPYTLVLIDGMPIISALGTVYGLNGIPASLVDRIEIVKGPSGAIYGPEAVAGTVNIVTKQAGNVPPLSFSANGSSHGELNLDFGGAVKMRKWRTLLSGNGYHFNLRHDFNGDGFTDVPLSQRFTLFNKWEAVRPQSRQASLAARVYGEDRFGGQMHWLPEHQGSSEVYGENILTKRAELTGVYDLALRGEIIRFQMSLSHHDQQSWYGNTSYDAVQTTAFGNMIWNTRIGKNHSFTGGLTARWNRYEDNTPATANGADARLTPGLFVQDEFTPGKRVSLLGGARLDYDAVHGPVVSPRFNVKWTPKEFTTLRFTTGTGFRNVNLFTEEHAALSGSRTVVMAEELRPEQSLNATAGIVQALNICNSAATLEADVFYTYFTNKIIPDYETDANLIVYRNLSGHAIIRGVSAKVTQSFVFPLRAEAGVTLLDVYQTDESGGRNVQEFTPGFSGNFNLSYRWEKLRTQIGYSGKVTGPMHLPRYDAPFTRPEKSEWFSMQNVQVTTEISPALECMFAIRNLLNYTQDSPLINPSQPFSDTFDTSYVWGPLQPRRFIAGFSWKMSGGQQRKK